MLYFVLTHRMYAIDITKILKRHILSVIESRPLTTIPLKKTFTSKTFGIAVKKQHAYAPGVAINLHTIVGINATRVRIV